MIYIFRKEMKKWKNVLWVVFFAMTGSTFWAYLGYKKNNPAYITIAKYNGNDIKLIDYQDALENVNRQINMYKNYAERLGIPVDMFLAMAGLLDPEKAAFNTCLNNKVLDIEKDYFNIELDSEYLEKELLSKLPEELKDAYGNINMDVYKRYLAAVNLTPEKFENRLSESIEREFFEGFLTSANYIPLNNLKESFTNSIAKKSFNIVKFNFDDYLKKEAAHEIKNEEINKFYNEHKEEFRIPEKRKANYWVINSNDYAKKIVVDESQIQSFYEKNKSILFRIAPKVKVRHILFKVSKNDAADKIEKVLSQAKTIREKIVSKKANFIDMAKQYSQDEKTNSNGGLVDFFEKGSYDPEFEKAALKLQNEGEISDIIKTKDGYELIQLEKRMPTSYKSLDSVRNDVIKSVKAKKVLTVLSADIKRAVYEASANDNIVNKFISENNLILKESKLLEKKDSVGSELENMLAEKIFSNSKKEKQYGFFNYKDDFVLFQVVSVQKSYIPELKDAKAKIMTQINAKNAKISLKNNLKSAKAAVLNKSKNIKDLAAQLGLNLIETKAIKNSDNLQDLGLDAEFAKRAFVLDSADQVLSYKHNSDYYLVQFRNIEQTSLISFEIEKNKLISEALNKSKGLYLQGFIASLFRTAKLEKFEKFLDNKNANYPINDIDI
ncbi:MAG: PpiC-type peptidyl-prolyl cis-trans isomerase [candidate division TM6 bacterium GW2011_GWF2_28_16]|nr:MAG: PpiC-type peptidyl-prolyl cis-trans isomerase [candidate division TM6 bacterium GW2011_GWF2_28_16]